MLALAGVCIGVAVVIGFIALLSDEPTPNPATDANACTMCGGTGLQLFMMPQGDGAMLPMYLPCTMCGGTGRRQ